jgi:prolyl-tRNA synthetase
MGCYGIGLARTLATIVETSFDEKGIVWPNSVAPYQVHLVGLNDKAEGVYKKLQEKGIEVLYDDRDVSAGEKFADADLLGMPVRLVVSNKTGEHIEYKKRTEKEAKLLSFEQVLGELR